MNSFNFVPKNEENRVTASTVVMKEFRRQLTLIDLRARFSKYRNTTNWKQKLLSISYIVNSSMPKLSQSVTKLIEAENPSLHSRLRGFWCQNP